MPFAMSDEPRVLSPENLPDSIRILNESSRGMSFEWHLDLFGFLALARYWNISEQHTLLGYEDGQPAALIITATDPETREAYIVYWAALPQFRKGRTAIRLFESCCQKLYDDGYEILYGASVPDRPVRRYRFIKSDVEYAILDLQAASTDLPESQSRFEVREIDLETISTVALPPGEPVHWCQRNAFLRNGSMFFQILGAFEGETLRAYAISVRKATPTMTIDFRSPDSSLEAGYELLRWLFSQEYRPPLFASDVFENSYAHRMLSSAGFTVKRRFDTLIRDLRTTCKDRTISL
jgi:hypothetical protein